MTTINTQNLIGYLVWHRFSMNSLTQETLDQALKAAGFEPDDWGVKAVPAPSAYNWAASNAGTANYSVGDEQRLAFLMPITPRNVSDEAVHAVQIGRRVGRRKSDVGQIAVIAHAHKYELISWAWLGFDRNDGESDQDYTDRFKAHVDSDPNSPFGSADVNAARSRVQRVLSYYGRTANRVENNRMHEMLKAALGRPEIKALSMKKQGGVYFVPNDPDATINPAETIAKLAAVIESLGDNEVYLFEANGATGQSRAIEATAKLSLNEAVTNVTERLDQLANEGVKNIKQLTSQADAVRKALDDAQLYRRLLGLQADDLDASVQALQERIKEMGEAHRASRKSGKTAASKRSKSSRRQKLIASIAATLVSAGIDKETALEKATATVDANESKPKKAPENAPKTSEPKDAPKSPDEEPKAKTVKSGSDAPKESKADASKKIRNLARQVAKKDADNSGKLEINGQVLQVVREGRKFRWEVNGERGEAKTQNALIAEVLGQLFK